MIVLYSSKTHNKAQREQKIKVSAKELSFKQKGYSNKHFCPFQVLRQYVKVRGDYSDESEQFFIFSDGSPVTAVTARAVLKNAIKAIGLNEKLYDLHSLRIGRASQLIELGYSVEDVKTLGRWKSNVVYKYIRS